MAETESAPLLHSCTNCAALIDVSEEQPFSQVHCPMCGTSMVRTQFNNFALQEVLGSGGMGAVYKALDMNLQRMVALKVVRKEFSSDAKYVEQFEREARITASVNHPNVVRVFSFGSDRGLFYIAMELVDKGSLDDLMGLQGRVGELQMLEVGMQVAQGLQAAKRAGLIHRDVKPGNILFADAHTAKIVDFGLALLAEHEAESRGEVWGTPYYVAPEKLNHEPEDFRSDIYSLGGTLFHAVAGRPPFEAETASMVALKHIKSQKVSLQAFAPDVSSATAYVINRMLHKDPEERYQSYDDLIEHLSYARTQLESAASMPRQRPRVQGESRAMETFSALMTILLLLLIFVGGGLAFYFRENLFKKPEAEPEPQPTAIVESPTQALKPALKSVVEQYAEARHALATGNFPNARERFAVLAANNQAVQPLHSWLSLQQALSAMLQGEFTEARELCRTVGEGGMFSDKAEDQQLALFFVTIGKEIADGVVKRAVECADLKRADHGPLGLLMYGLSDWNLGAFAEARALLDEFSKSAPRPPYDWMSDYKALAVPYLERLAAYERALATAEAAKAEESWAPALEEMAAARVRLQLKPGALMGEKLDAAEAEIRARIAAAEERAQREDRGRLSEARAAFENAYKAYKFAAAVQAVQSIQVKTAVAAAERDGLLQKAKWLEAFQQQLIEDIKSKPYPQPLIKKNGSRVISGANKANSSQLEVSTPYGSVAVQWVELPPAMIYAMGSHYLSASTASEEERRWLLGVFACQFGMEKEGKELLLQSVEARECRNSLALFFEAVEAR